MTHVVCFNANAEPAYKRAHWPAFARDGGTMVDLRLFAGSSLEFQPDKLAGIVPDDLIALAGSSIPPGFLLLPN